MFMWLANLARGVPSTRPVFLKIMFPHRDLLNEDSEPSAGIAPPGYDFPCLGNSIIKHMCAIDMAVKHWSNELMYILVDEDGTITFIQRARSYSHSMQHLILTTFAMLITNPSIFSKWYSGSICSFDWIR